MRCLACDVETGGYARYCDAHRSKKGVAPFLSWDGEGITLPDNTHLYTLLANGHGEYIEHRDDEKKQGLSTVSCLEFLLQSRSRCINSWFSFDYDVWCILRDIPLERLKTLHERGFIFWSGYYIKFLEHKQLSISDGTRAYTAYDSFGFFQQNFIGTLRRYGKANPDLLAYADIIQEGKDARSKFYEWPAEKVRAYNDAELKSHTLLMETLRESFVKVSLVPAQWYGPGALANAWLRKMHPEHGAAPPHEVVQYCYFGGRIDNYIIGEIEADNYDKNSAYPSAMLDCIACDGWTHVEAPTRFHDGALVHVLWDLETFDAPYPPFPWRAENGRIFFPKDGEGWYYGIEVKAAQRMFGKNIRILSCYEPAGTIRFPLREPIQDLYEQRLRLKADKDSAENAVKLILNSLYGKFAQRPRNGKVSKNQNYYWAGFITAHCRASMLDALREVSQHVVGISTDGLFSTVPLNLDEGEQLGQWTKKSSGTMLHCLPGVYASFTDDGVKLAKKRGYPQPFDLGQVLRHWGCNTELETPGVKDNSVTFATFIKPYLVREGDARACTFVPQSRKISDVTILGFSKRAPDPMEILQWKNWTTKHMLAKARPKNSHPMSSAYKPLTQQEYDKMPQTYYDDEVIGLATSLF